MPAGLSHRMAPKFGNFAANRLMNPLQIHLNHPKVTTIRRTQSVPRNRSNWVRLFQNGSMGGEKKQYWLLKTEAGEWSWEDQAANGGLSKWDGVKNKQAQKNLKSMRLGDLCFFYHSGARARRVVGVVSVVKEWYLDDEEDDNTGAVDVRAEGEMRRPVDLKEMKGDDGLKGFDLFRQPRLSVVPVPGEMWDRICDLGGGIKDGDANEEDEDEEEG